MAPSIRKAIGTVKDQTSIGLAKVASNMAPELEVAIVKATSHDDGPANEKYIIEILTLTSYSTGYMLACVSAISKRLSKTRDWIVALKTLILVHRLLNEGDLVFQEEIMRATKKGTRLLNLSTFRDEAHSTSWDHSAFIRAYAMYLDQKLELMLFDRKLIVDNSSHGENERFASRVGFRSPPSRAYDHGEYGGDSSCREGGYGMNRKSSSFGDLNEVAGKEVRDGKATTPLREMRPERIFGKMGQLQMLLDRFLSCRPTGQAKQNRMILVALYRVVKESFHIYADICHVLAILLDKFFDMDYPDCVKTLDAYTSASKQIDELIVLYNWCKDVGVARSSEYPEVQKITGKLLETLEEFVRDRAKREKNPDKKDESRRLTLTTDEVVLNMSEIKALPPPENYSSSSSSSSSSLPAPHLPPPATRPGDNASKPPLPPATDELVNLRDDSMTADDQGNKLALALFSEPAVDRGDGSWQAFPPDAEPDNADWELALVDSASHLSRQKAALGGGLDPLLLNGIYDQAMVRQQVSTAELSGGSASSVALPGPGRAATPVLALPAPDGTVVAANSDPFAASSNIPPPSYVQMVDMEKKQQLLVQEQMVWQQYSKDGMLGQANFAKISQPGYFYPGGH